MQLEQLECLHSGNAPCHHMITHTIDSYRNLFIPHQDVLYNYKSINLTKPRTYVKGYINYYICIKFKSCSLKNGFRNANNANLRNLIAATGLVISNWIQIVNFSARVTVKFDGWPRKTIGHFFYTTSSFVYHFKSIGEFKLDLQSGNAQFG